ncbi:methyltransferase domain-containing protein [Gammaproteobacteria bacterium]|nr:methyltransferase domain-containing protein [Gammaproteobacteria bacterium]MDC0128951.1 methyltransferase domain-containing protein [Gammaproteobacteria bacterium]
MLKHKYFKTRNDDLSVTNEKGSVGREALAIREIETFKKLCQIKGIEPKLDGVTFLDLGSGDQFLRFAVDGTNYIPLDIDDMDFDSEALPIPDDSVDILFSLAVVEHINNIDHFMSECFRVLKPNGIIYLSTPNFRYCFRDFYNDPTHVRPFTEISLCKAVEYYGFKSVEVFPSARCKTDWFYKGKYRFTKCAYLPFLGTNNWAPSFLCGRATGIICLGIK